MQRVIDRVQIVQIDSVNVLARSQYLPFFSRLGPYDTALLDRARDRAPRRLVEYWAHEASLIPPSTWPLLDFRMRRALHDAWGGMQRVAREHPELVDGGAAPRWGPVAPSRRARSRPRSSTTCPDSATSGAGTGPLVKSALEHLFWAGQISSAGRTSQFERRYAALSRVLPRPLRGVWRRTRRPDRPTTWPSASSS